MFPGSFGPGPYSTHTPISKACFDNVAIIGYCIPVFGILIYPQTS